MFEKHGEVDIAWRCKPHEFNCKNIYVVVNGEMGFVPLVTAVAMVADNEPDIEIYSAGQGIEAFNNIPNPVADCWKITKITEKTAVLEITNFVEIVMIPQESHETWKTTYPMMRDLLLWLKKIGIQSLTFLTAMNSKNAEDAGEMMVADLYHGINPEHPITVATPAWAMPKLFNRMGGKSCVVCFLQDAGQFICDKSIATAKDYILASGLPYDEAIAMIQREQLMGMEEQINAMRNPFGFDGSGNEGGEWL